MICGSCKAGGVTVNHVKDCYDVKYGRHNSDGEPFPVAPVKAVPTLAEAPVEGIYYWAQAGTYFKVVCGTNTGNWYAKVYNDQTRTWEYDGRKPLHFLTALDRVSAQQAARFGQVTGSCVFCSRKLTDERSIEVGYGPVCAEREGLPWGEYAPNFDEPGDGRTDSVNPDSVGSGWPEEGR